MTKKTKIQFKTRSGSTYILDREAYTYTRVEHHPDSNRVPNFHKIDRNGPFPEPLVGQRLEIYLEYPNELEAPYIVTTSVTEVTELEA
jgi:hypothetical protein